MKVVFTKSPTGEPFKLAYSIDDAANVPDDLAKKLIDAGIAVELKDVQKATQKPAAPKSEKATRKTRRTETATKK